MGYFPFFMEIEDKKGVVLGGGQVAARKVEKLLPFGPRLICIAPVICARIESLAQGSDQLTLIYREACREDMEGACFVIAATDREDVNAWAAQWCRERQIPVNVVDDREKCTFFSCACSGRSAYRRYFFRREMSSRRFFYKKKSGEGITGGTGEYHRNTGRPEGTGTFGGCGSKGTCVVSGKAVCFLQGKGISGEGRTSRSIYGSASGGAARILGGGKGMTKIRIGTRGSKLALVQTTLVAEALRACWPGVETETVIIKTRGDKILDKPLGEIGDKGLFVSEFETALLEKRIDLAVHSAKDLPQRLAEGLEILAVPERADARDVLVQVKNKLPKAPVIGTGSLRRRLYVEKLWPGAQVKLIRGNVETRLAKLAKGEYDGIILAKAGLDRLGIIEREKEHFVFQPLDPEVFLPAACQGIIAVEGRADWEYREMVEKLSHRKTLLSFETERKVLEVLQADCSQPAAAYSVIEPAGIEKEKILLTVMYGGKESRGEWGVEERYALADVLSAQARGNV